MGSKATQFKPGQSGNPAGRRVEGAEFRELAKEKTPEAFQVVLNLMEKGRQETLQQIAPFLNQQNQTPKVYSRGNL